MSGRRIGMLGGTFDPIHRGHLDLGEAAADALHFTCLYVIPANVPPHRPQPFASGFHRFAMTALSVAGRAAWRASDLELRGEPPSFTALTLQQFHARGYASRELFFVMGADAFSDIESWKDYPQLLDRAHFVVVSRPGWPVDDLQARLPALQARMVRLPLPEPMPAQPLIILIAASTADVSSTAIRERCGEGLPLTGLVDARVEQHIEQHGLYRTIFPGRRPQDQASSIAAGRLHGED